MPKAEPVPADDVTIQTRVKKHLHVWFATVAAKRSMKRADVYGYAVRFAVNSGKDFLDFLDRMTGPKGPGQGP